MKSVYVLVTLMAIISTMIVYGDENDTRTHQCQEFCPLELSVICGTNDAGNAQTFPNECTMKSENCIKKSNFQKTQDGPCP